MEISEEIPLQPHRETDPGKSFLEGYVGPRAGLYRVTKKIKPDV
jgi:hypothetical protein